MDDYVSNKLTEWGMEEFIPAFQGMIVLFFL